MLLSAELRDPRRPHVCLFKRSATLATWESTFLRWVAFLPAETSRLVLARLHETLPDKLPDPDVVDETEFNDALHTWRENWQPHVSQGFHNNPVKAVELYCEGWGEVAVDLTRSPLPYEWLPASPSGLDLSVLLGDYLRGDVEGRKIVESLPSVNDPVSDANARMLMGDGGTRFGDSLSPYAPYWESAAFALKNIVLPGCVEFRNVPLVVVVASLVGVVSRAALGDD